MYVSNDRIIKYSLTDKVDTSHIASHIVICIIVTICDITVGGEG